MRSKAATYFVGMAIISLLASFAGANQSERSPAAVFAAVGDQLVQTRSDRPRGFAKAREIAQEFFQEGGGQAGSAPIPAGFEAASVKPGDKTSQLMRMSDDGDFYVAENVPLKTIVLDAFSLKPSLFSGPGWLEEERYSITARAPAGTTTAGKKLMLRQLLADRFQLKFHQVEVERLIYALVVASGGPKLTTGSGRDMQAHIANSTPGSRLNVYGTLSNLADALSSRLDRPVVDRTGLEGRYEIHVTGFAWPSQQDASPDLPSIFTAIQEQLGLRLHAENGQVNTFVVDHIERVPAGN